MRFVRQLLLGAAASAVGLLSLSTTKAAKPRCFPETFMFGSATASYQVEGAVKEGGRTPSMWDDFCREKEGYVCANVADDFYHRYKSDIKLMKDMNLQSFRFSISWSRVMNWDPATRRMKVNPEGLAFYHSLIDELRASNIEPILTLYHWDLPSELQTQLSPPGWLNAEIQDHFIEYSDLVFNEYGHKIDYWTTFNEPLSTVGHGYAQGTHAPGYTGSNTLAYTASYHLLLAHAKSVQRFRELKSQSVIGPKARIGIVLVSSYYYPLDASNPKDVAAAERGLDFDMGWFLTPIVTGDYPSIMREIVGDRLPKFTTEESELLKGSYDLFMLNHYGSRAVTDCDVNGPSERCATLTAGWETDRGIDDTGIMPGTVRGKTDSHGNNYCEHYTGYPPGYLAMIKYTHAKDPTADILLTENGWCGNDEIENMDQLKFFKLFVEQVYLAVVEEKIPVIGYTAWSLLDNYEWGSYGPRFGLFYVNFTSQTGSPDYYEAAPTDLARIPRPSAKWFTKVAATRCIDEWSELEVSNEQQIQQHHDMSTNTTLMAGTVVGVVGAALIAAARIKRNRLGYEGIPLRQSI